MDPNTNTRRQYAKNMRNNFTIPDDASDDWKKYGKNLEELTWKLAFHDAMQPNIDQTFMTPAASKNKVYFMWDFVSRTLATLTAVPPSLQGLSRKEQEAWSDCVGRSVMAANLILDTKPGMLDMMVSTTASPGSGPAPTFGEDILQIARTLKG